MDRKPRILLFTGEGKGKTTAALGMVFRAGGHGMRSCILQFLKADHSVGEAAAAEHSPEVEIHLLGLGFVPAADAPEFARHREAALAGLRKAAEMIACRRFSLVVLDEICSAVALGLLEEGQVLELLKRTPPETTLVLTGRGATPSLIDAADTVTEMRCVKHAFESGRDAEDGVER